MVCILRSNVLILCVMDMIFRMLTYNMLIFDVDVVTTNFESGYLFTCQNNDNNNNNNNKSNNNKWNVHSEHYRCVFNINVILQYPVTVYVDKILDISLTNVIVVYWIPWYWRWIDCIACNYTVYVSFCFFVFIFQSFDIYNVKEMNEWMERNVT